MNIENKQSEEIYLIKHRLNSLIDVWTAFQTFNLMQVEVGVGKVCFHDKAVDKTANTLLIIYQSYLYSLFDPKGTNFKSATLPIVGQLSPKARQIRNEILLEWEKIEEPVKKIRHNIGFHGGKKMKNHQGGFEGFKDNKMHRLSGEYIFYLMKAFFKTIELDQSKENTTKRTELRKTRDEIYAIATELKSEILKEQ